MNIQKEFIECDACRAKPGMPILCNGCISNRGLIEDQREYIKQITIMVGEMVLERDFGVKS